MAFVALPGHLEALGRVLAGNDFDLHLGAVGDGIGDRAGHFGGDLLGDVQRVHGDPVVLLLAARARAAAGGGRGGRDSWGGAFAGAGAAVDRAVDDTAVRFER